jgi:hypothetical protein
VPRANKTVICLQTPLTTSFCVESPKARDRRKESGRSLGLNEADERSKREKESYERLDTSARGRLAGKATAKERKKGITNTGLMMK